jgi:hypothetical protein
MAISYSFEVQDQLLRVKAKGKDDNLEQVEEYGMAVIAAALSSGCIRILCDESELEYTLGTIDNYESAKFISENSPHVVRVALVCKPEQYEDASFWETVAVNRGLVVRFFKSISEAEDWLV